MKRKMENMLDEGEMRQEKMDGFNRYLRDSKQWQQNMAYIGITCAMILLGIFLRLVFS